MINQILQELYIGKTPELLEIESLIHKIRSSNTEANFLTNPTYSKDMEKINRIFEDLFGFEIFSLTIMRSSAANAFTMPVSCAIDIMPQCRVKDNLLVSNKGFKYKKEAGYCCSVFMFNSLLFDETFTDAEIVAIILHEIGHNFQTVINDTLYYTSDITRVLNIIVNLIRSFTSVEDTSELIGTIIGTGIGLGTSTNKFRKLYAKFIKDIRDNESLALIFGMAGLVLDATIEVRMNIKYLLGLVYRYGNIPGIVKKCILNKISDPFGKTGEEVADSFATIYGYGPDISSAMVKFDTTAIGPATQRVLMSVPVLGHLLTIYNLPITILVTAFDEHPSGIQRAQIAKADLERELTQSYMDPAMKSKIKKDIVEIDKAIDRYNKARTDIKNPKAIQVIWFSFIYEMTKGGIGKKSERLMSNIDKAFDDAKLR